MTTVARHPTVRTRASGSVQLDLRASGTGDLRIATSVHGGQTGARNDHWEIQGAQVGIGHGHHVFPTGQAIDRVPDVARAPGIGVGRCAAHAGHRSAAVAGVAGGGRDVQLCGERAGLFHVEAAFGRAAVGIGHDHRVGAGRKTVDGLGGLPVVPVVFKGCKTIGCSGDAAIIGAVAAHMVQFTLHAHDAHGHHLIGRAGQDAGIATDDPADVMGLFDRTDRRARQVLAGLSGNIHPVEAVGADLPLVAGRGSEGGIGGRVVIAYNGGQGVLRL